MGFGLMLLAFLWGIAEATFFFIIPDVILTFIAIHGFRAGLDASLIALAGALIGGSIMYIFAVKRYDHAYRFVWRVPAIQEKMLHDVQVSLREKGLIAMVLGPIRGIPYKAYAIMAPGASIRFIPFFLASIPARFIRFFLTSVAAWYAAEVLFGYAPMWVKYLVWGIVWVIVYVIYFTIHPWKGDKK
ncbi:hypothetical protein ACFSKI_12015 [Pseudogracilibacillus auburnensis]|uniref:Membrane protein DedA with SNARE-associated domain n=1 Tax=Pseudogracilibacillus auburnensis TaxID=1494959 RepID=A0A2V3W9K8_9BACI|nr:hypothetical protein [Pseudogracilibacillus auburnensis]MBO1001981.1 hypothetical protein [Pseudogracilibacillus auburnensis]PXW90206.1 membrane protein DedA with SNARE-associated domain [Pseudogracilibacillus auburnensis]